MLRVAVPNKGALAEAVNDILGEAGYRGRTGRELVVRDANNNVEFFFLRPKDIAIYVGSGELDLGITGRDLALDSAAPVDERLSLGIGRSTFRYAAPAGREWRVEDLYDMRMATSYPNLVLADLTARGVQAEVIRLDGAVEISIELGVADAIADVVGVRPHAEPAQPGRLRRAAVRVGSRAHRAARVRSPGPGAQPAHRPDAGRGVRPAVLDARLRLPARAAGRRRANHPRSGIADGVAAGRREMGGGAGDGAAQDPQQRHGRIGRAGREGDPGLRHPLLPGFDRTRRAGFDTTSMSKPALAYQSFRASRTATDRCRWTARAPGQAAARAVRRLGAVRRSVRCLGAVRRSVRFPGAVHRSARPGGRGAASCPCAGPGRAPRRRRRAVPRECPRRRSSWWRGAPLPKR